MTQYYIGTGLKNCYYTLRQKFTERVYTRTDDRGGVDSRLITRDYHIQNLSTDREKAIEKARELTGASLDANFEIVDISKRKEIDWSVFQSGKHKDRSIHEVFGIDKDYLIWCCMNLSDSKTYKPTIELAQYLVKNDILKIEQEIQEKADKTEAISKILCEDWSDILAVLDKKSENSNFCQDIAKDIRSGIVPSEKTLNIISDIYARDSGRRGSKKYNEALDRFDETINKSLDAIQNLSLDAQNNSDAAPKKDFRVAM